MKASDVFKQLIGKSVSLLPTRNNIRKKGISPYLQVKQATILSFKRTKGTLLIDGDVYEREFNFDMDVYVSNGSDLLAIDCGFNAGYEIYATEEDLLYRNLAQKIKSKFNPQNVSTAQWLKIGELLGIEQTETNLVSHKSDVKPA